MVVNVKGLDMVRLSMVEDNCFNWHVKTAIQAEFWWCYLATFHFVAEESGGVWRSLGVEASRGRGTSLFLC